MASGIALSLRNIPTRMLSLPEISRRIYSRGGEDEVRFWYYEKERVLPVIQGGQLRLASWGAPIYMKGSTLPKTGWVWKERLTEGSWIKLETQEVVIPANAGCDNGIWYRVREGMQGLLVETPSATIVYMIVDKATHYFQTMTRSSRMPVLLGEVI